MIIIPAINEPSFAEVEKKIKTAAAFGAEIVHLDVTDGKFACVALWNNFFELRDFIIANKNLKMQYEVHLMVSNPDEVIDNWIDIGIKRIIVHVESVKDLMAMKKKCDHFGTELLLAASPDTSVDKLLESKDVIKNFLVLTVRPGKAGQLFRPTQLEKIKLLKQGIPDARIEVDGGVNLENAAMIKDAGADLVISASTIWRSEDPAATFKKLQAI